MSKKKPQYKSPLVPGGSNKEYQAPNAGSGKGLASIFQGPQPKLYDTLWFPFFTVANQLRFLAVVCLLIYGNSLFNEYAVDDGMVIVGNKFTTQGFGGIKDILTKDSFLGSMDQNVLPGGRYRPLSIVTFAIEWQFFERNPFVSHLVNVLMYVICVLLIFWVLRFYLIRNLPAVAFGATLLFAVHPVHIEAVGNLKGRDEIMALIFMFGSLICIFEYLKSHSKSTILLVGALFSFFLSLLSKENPVTFVVILPLMLYFFSSLPLKKILEVGGMYLGMTVFYILIRLAVTGLNVTTLVDDVFQQPYLHASFTEKYATIVLVLGKYLSLLVYPHPLSFDYSFEQIPYVGLTDVGFIISFLVHLGMLVYALLNLKKKTMFSFCILYYLLSISIVSNIVFNLGGVMGERFLYQASLGFTLAVAYGFYLLTQRIPAATGKWVVIGGLLILSTAAGAKVIVRNRDWKSNETLYVKDVKHAPNSSKANKCAAEIYLRLGMNAEDSLKKKENLEKAVHYLDRAVEIYPTFIQAYLDLGAAHHFLKHPEKAESAWNKAEKIDPNNEFTSFYFSDLLAPSIVDQAFADYKQQKFDAAREGFEKAVRYRPTDHFSWYHLGHLYGLQKDMPKSVSSFEKAVAQTDTIVDYWYNLGGAYFTVGEYAKAYAAWQKASAIQPDYPNLQQGIYAAEQIMAQRGVALPQNRQAAPPNN